MSEQSKFSLLSQRLKRFNRKERYWLLENVLNNFSRSEINANFKAAIERELKINIPNSGVYWALDYHFDWIYAALSSNENLDENIKYKNSESFKIRGTQQDIDFLISFDKTIILIEAKGVTGWDQKQFLKKQERILELQKYISLKGEYKIYFITTSPNEFFLANIKYINNKKWPHIKMNIEQDLILVKRCDKHGGDYENWKILPSKNF